ncbi:MAG: M28 family metallopeptidase [Firmicutes bacterium]|nr:M28 family metallopeptidase [Bacillota bacterium]
MYKKFVKTFLYQLSKEIGCRPAGSPEAHNSCDLIANYLRTNEYSIIRQKYDCPHWELLDSKLRINEKAYPAVAAVHSPSCNVKALPVFASTEDELKNTELSGRIAVLSGSLSSQGYFPKNFDFFRIDDQDRIIRILEEKKPEAIIFVTQRDENHVSLIEDSEFSFPVMTVSSGVGKMIAGYPEKPVEMIISSKSIPSHSANIIGRYGIESDNDERIVICAHYDTKHGTPGAVDNGTGTTAMLLAAELIKNNYMKNQVKPRCGIEIVAFGGEDSWYPGDASYFEFAAGYLNKIKLAINIDGISVKEENDTIAFLECSELLEGKILETGRKFPGIVKTAPWYESDHSFFARLKIPTLAFTTQNLRGLIDTIVHTPADSFEITDPEKVVSVAQYIADIVSADCPV